MHDWIQLEHFAALDWASDHHDVVVVSRHGQVVADFRFDHSAAGWAQFDQAMAPYGQTPIAVETSQGSAVDQLLQRHWTVYPVNPKSAERYRDRKLPSGTKTDHFDAWSLAEALRTDGHGWKPLLSQDPLLIELRLICRDEVVLIEQRTALVNQLQAALREYYPTALAVFDDWTHPAAWAFVLAFPTPQVLQQTGRRRWEKFLHAHRLWRTDTAPARLARFAQASQFTGSAPVTAAKQLTAVALARLLQTLEGQLEAFRARIEALFARHPDHHLFGSLPGAGPKLAPRLLAGLGDNRQEFPDAQRLQCRAGTAPISYQSGQIRQARLRQACDDFLRATVHLWADLSRRRCPWAQAYYQAHRDKGQSHACALRCLGQKWLKILWKMWQTRTAYDPELHQKNQMAHGSWVLQLLTPPAPATAR
jgi:transposase